MMQPYKINSYFFMLTTFIHGNAYTMERPLGGSPSSSTHTDDSDELARTWASSSSNSDLSSPSITDELQKTEIAKDLHGACKNGNLDTVRNLLNTNRDRINDRDTSRSSLLQLAVCNEHEYALLVEFLLERGVTIDSTGLSELLIQAISRGHNDVAKLLLARGALSNSVGVKKQTALHYAAEKGSDELVQLLIDKGAQVLASDEDNTTPFQIARQHVRSSIMNILLRATENLPAAPQSPGLNRLWLASRAQAPLTNKELFFKAAETGDVSTIKTLRDQSKVNIKTTDDAGLTALHRAALAGQTNAVQELLEQGLSVDIQTHAGSTPLHYAVRGGHIAIVRLLLAQGADVKAKDKWGDTPYEAAGFSREKINKYQEVIRLLAEYGAHIGRNDEVKKLFAKLPLTALLVFEPEDRVITSVLKALNNRNHDTQDLHGALIRASVRGYRVVVWQLLQAINGQSIIWERIHEALACATRNNPDCVEPLSDFFRDHSQQIMQVLKVSITL